MTVLNLERRLRLLEDRLMRQIEERLESLRQAIDKALIEGLEAEDLYDDNEEEEDD